MKKQKTWKREDVIWVFIVLLFFVILGSTKFKKEYNEVNRKLTFKGKIVISVSCFGHTDKLEFTSYQKKILDAIHLKKIDISDSIYIIDVEGYIGDSTKREIEYAKDNGKNIYYYSKGDFS